MPLLDSSAAGVFIIAATPFHPDGALDLDGTDRLIDWYLGHGVSGVTILGQMGEAPKLTFEESVAVARRVLARTGDVPVVVGVTSPGFASQRALAAEVMAAGAAGVMIAAPGALRGDEAVAGWFAQAVAALEPGTPWVLQDYPLSGTPPLGTGLIRRVADTVPGCVMLKHEDWPGLDKVSGLRALEAQGARRLSILCGNGGMFLPEELRRGADGAMTGFSYPEMLVGLCRLMSEGEEEKARDLFDAYLPLLRYEQQPGQGLAVRKHLLARRGALASATLRVPCPRLSTETLAELDGLVARLERVLAHGHT